MELRDAATVMLVRDGDGLEVCLFQRHPDAVFVGGAHVFAGGGVDPADRQAADQPEAAGLTDAEASARLGVPAGGLAFWVAAVREAFEEAGVLVARHADGRDLRFDTPSIADRFAAHRVAVDTGRTSVWDVCRDEGLRLALDQLVYVSHWITPEGAPRRYDTRFFLAACPDGQEPCHDDREVVTTVWATPADALERARRREWDLILPTVRNLELLADFRSVDEAFGAVAAAQGVAPLPLSEPGGQSRVRLQHDPPSGPDKGRPLVRAGVDR
jgi:8-oxo-dGTP pyrophosphatase MutT (NUDIX family)